MTRSVFDVVIVGGGPAGATAARVLAGAGLAVAVFDRATFPRDKPCAGWITPPVVDLVGLDPVEYAREHVWQRITGFRLRLVGQRAVEIRYPRPVSFGVRRIEFDWYLLERAGAALQLGRPVTRIERRGDWWVVNDGAARAPLLVGAGGHFCPVARALHPGSVRGPVVAAQEIEFVMSPRQEAACVVDPEMPELVFCRDLRGYGWVFRKGRVLNVGFGRLETRRFREHVAAFLASLIQDGRVPADLETAWPGHAYLLYRSSPRRPVHPGALLVGDALGLADDASGEGIRPAIESGWLAARAILAADGRYDDARLRPYAEAVRARFGGSSLFRTAVSWVPEWLRQAAGARLIGTPWVARHLLLDRLFLHAGEPALALSAGIPGAGAAAGRSTDRPRALSAG